MRAVLRGGIPGSFQPAAEKVGVMDAVSASPGVSLREATQRKLRRFSELRGTNGGTPALPRNREGGPFTCREICWAVASSLRLTCGPRTLAQA